MKSIFFPILIAALSFGCNENQLNHKLEYEPKGPCASRDPQYHMESNIAGDRYTFQECLPEDFDGKGYQIIRKGDTLVVSFTDNQKPKKAFALTLDIDAYPKYSCILLGSELLHVGAVEE